jgi:hypothetical protein
MLNFASTLLILAPSAADDAAAGLVGVIVILLIFVIGLAFYFLPTMIAIFRPHHQCASIAVINLFFGWTFIGWVIALAWSVSATRER